MMKVGRLLLVLAVGASPLRAQTAQTEDDARAAITAVLAHQAAMRGPEGAAQTCVVQALAPPPAAAGTDNPMMPENTVRIFFQWHVPEAAAVVRPPRPPRPEGERRRRDRDRPAPVPLPAAVPAALAARLDAARAQAAAAPPSTPMTVEAPLVPAPMQLQQRGRDCAPLQLTAPGFAGDLAFVETAYACGATCGNGSLYALERQGGRWLVIAVGDVWIS